MTIKLSKANERYIREMLLKGEYESVDDVVKHALSIFRKIERMRSLARDDLRREIDLGLRDIEEGRVSDWDAEALKRELVGKARKAS